MKTMTLKTPKTTLSFALSTLVVSSLTLIPSEAYAITHCYDFSGPAVGTIYQVGDTVNTRHADINLQTFQTVNGPSQNPKQEATITNSNLAGATTPELDLHSIVAQILPNQGVQSVQIKFADNTGGAYQQNFGVNGERQVLQGGLGQLNGQTLGRSQFGGEATVSVQTNAVPGGNWTNGSITVQALPGQTINAIAIGGSSQFRIDNFCMTL